MKTKQDKKNLINNRTTCSDSFFLGAKTSPENCETRRKAKPTEVEMCLQLLNNRIPQIETSGMTQ